MVHAAQVHSSPLAGVVVLLLSAGAAFCGAESKFDERGRLEQIQLGKGWLPLQTDVRIALKGWGKILSLGEARAAAESSAGRRSWKATLSDGAEPAAEVEQAVSQAEGKAVYDIRATGKGSLDIEGVFFWIDIPCEHFAGGAYKAGGGAAQPQSGELPRVLPEQFRLWSGVTDKLVLTAASGKAELVLELDPAVNLLVQDARTWSQHFTVLVHVHSGNLAKGQTAKLRAVLFARGDVEDTPAQLALDAASVRYRLAGIGGNYCFNIESPVTRYTLDNLKVAFARTEMTLEQWEPENDNADPAQPDWRRLVAGDVPGSRLRREFELMRELSRKKTPFSATIWRLPAWLYSKPPTKENMNNRIAEDKWPEALECIATYLQYAQEKYGAQADYFSFNEPNIGCRVAFNAAEHRDAIKRIGAHLAQAGLKTKMLLGDVAGPRDTHKYVAPASADQEAMKYVGAVSMHSWGGASPAQYSAWADLAAKLKLPLIVAEAGPDPAAWQGARYQSFQYGVREMAHYQELLLHARPQAIMFWEYTGDYSLLAANRFDKTRLQLTERFCFQKHWCDLTPAGSEALAATCDNDSVLFTAFRFPGAGGGTGYTLHLGNQKWARRANVQGLSAGLRTLNAVRTSRGEMFKLLEPIAVVDGKISLELPGQSLTSLSTLPIPELKEPGAP